MRLNGDPSTRDEARGIAVGLVIMDEETDPGRATGYYWWRTTGETESEGGDGWRRGVHDGRGPHASAEAAFRAASRNDAAEMELAWRLDEAASLVRAGHIDPTRESLAAFLEKALEINAERRAADPGTERTALGPLHRGRPAGDPRGRGGGAEGRGGGHLDGNVRNRGAGRGR